MERYELPHRVGRITGYAMKIYWRRAWDLNPRRFPLPVFKTGALGHYASPPWENLPLTEAPIQINYLSKLGRAGLR